MTPHLVGEGQLNFISHVSDITDIPEITQISVISVQGDGARRSLGVLQLGGLDGPA
jgi:hypothetical protein